MIDRNCAAQFRAAARKCVLGRPKGPSPPVVIEQSPEGSELICDFGEVALGLRQPLPGALATRMAAPGSLLSELENVKGGPATVTSGRKLARCTWDQAGSARESTWTPIDVPEKLPRADTLEHGSRELLEALFECGRCTARESVKFALTRLQIQGQEGRVIGSDGRQLLIWRGFGFPFAESLLVPAIPAFGLKAIVGTDEVRIGRTASHVVVTAGPWTIWLKIIEGRFPNVAQVIPASSEHQLLIGTEDLRPALDFCERVVETDGEHAMVTVVIGNSPMLRARADAEERITELSLASSRAKGKPVTVVFNRDQLHRALRLGLRHIRTPSETGPAVLEDERRIYVSTTFLPARAIPARPAADQPSNEQTQQVIPITQGVRSMASETNGRNHAPEEAADPVDFLAEAEELRDAICDIGRRAGRLVAALKQLQKQRRVLETFASRYLSRNG